jgi:hypothetical protein
LLFDEIAYLGIAPHRRAPPNALFCKAFPLTIHATVENVLTILGVLRAGLIAMPLPVWWRRADIIAALNRIGPMALIVSSRIAAGDHYQLAIRVAAEVFPIRYVCG